MFYCFLTEQSVSLSIWCQVSGGRAASSLGELFQLLPGCLPLTEFVKVLFAVQWDTAVKSCEPEARATWLLESWVFLQSYVASAPKGLHECSFEVLLRAVVMVHSWELWAVPVTEELLALSQGCWLQRTVFAFRTTSKASGCCRTGWITTELEKDEGV